MPGSLGGLVVSLGLNAVDFTTGLTKAERDAQKFAANFSNNVAAGIIKAEIALRALSEAARIAIHAIPDLIDQAGHFQDLAEKTGASAESLASFSIAAKVAGTSMDDLAAFSIKLSKNLSTMDEESSKTAAALTALGIPIKEFKSLDPAAQMERLAKALQRFSDVGGGKAAALEAIAKGGAALLPFLKELEEGTGRVNILTAEQIKRADEFSDAQKRASATLNAYAQALATEFAPAITAVSLAVADVIKEMLGINNAAGKLPTEDVRKFAENAAIALAHLGDVVLGLVRVYQVLGEVAKRSAVTEFFTGEERKSIATLGKDVDAILQQLTLVERTRRQLAQQRATAAALAVGPPEPPKKTLVFDFNQSAAERAARQQKLILDQQLKALDQFVAEERDTLSARESFLRLYYQSDLIGLREFFEGRSNARAEALARETEALNRQIVLLQSFAAKAKPEARIAAETKLADVIAKRDKIQQQAAQNSAQAFVEEQQAIDKLADSVDQAVTALRALQGETVSAGLAGFDAAHRKLQSDLQLLQKSPIASDQSLAATGLAAIEQTRKLTANRLRLDEVTKDYSLTLQELGIAQQRIDISTQTGNLTTLEGLRAKSALAERYTGILKEQLVAAQALAAASGRREDIIRVQELQVQLEALAATGDLVAKQFQDIFVTSFAQGIEEAISGTKSLKQAFTDMAKSIERDISRIAAKNISEAILGGSGTGGSTDWIAMLAKLFASSAGGGGGGWVSGGDIGGLAGGTSFWRGGPTVVGEEGPEVVNLPRGSQVIPNEESQKMFGPRMNFVINVLPGASTKTAQQAAAMTGVAVQRAMVRNT